jgi:thermostable 8-oxoguanine DNA glycosylase
MKTIDDIKNEREWNALSFNYQEGLTEKLDSFEKPFDQNTINEIVLWKTNRYAEIENETLELLNAIKVNAKELDKELTIIVLRNLLDKKQRGIGLPMASTLLRFKNKNIYQIIDQRSYRFLYGIDLKLKSNIESQIELYLSYLVDLKQKCDDLNIPFENADRIFYLLDKALNKGLKLNGY